MFLRSADLQNRWWLFRWRISFGLERAAVLPRSSLSVKLHPSGSVLQLGAVRTNPWSTRDGGPRPGRTWWDISKGLSAGAQTSKRGPAGAGWFGEMNSTSMLFGSTSYNETSHS